MDPYHHSLSSVRKWGGVVEDFIKVHRFFDASKAHLNDIRHRAARHHSEGIATCIEVFGPTLVLSTGRVIPTRWVAEQHVLEDLGRIPTLADWFRNLKLEPWMLRVAVKHAEVEDGVIAGEGEAGVVGAAHGESGVRRESEGFGIPGSRGRDRVDGGVGDVPEVS